MPTSTTEPGQTEEALCGDPAPDDKLSDKPGFVFRVARGSPSPSA